MLSAFLKRDACYGTATMGCHSLPQPKGPLQGYRVT